MRFDGLDRLKGVALWAMLLHHLLAWTVGDARDLLGTDRLAVTDLAAPLFAVAAGAGAAIVGGRLRQRAGAGTGRVLLRWATIAGWGVLLGMSGDHRIDSVGVLETLAVVGVVVTLVARWAAPSAAAWGLAAVAFTAVADAVIEAATDAGGWWHAAFGLRFPWLSYLALGAVGAAVATLLGDRERLDRLAVAAGAAVLAVTTFVLLQPGAWTVARYPSGLSFVVLGVVVALVAWVALASLPSSVLTRGMERAGRRTLLVYVGHYAVRMALDAAGWYQELSGAAWTVTAAAAAAAIAVASALPRPSRGSPAPAAAPPARPQGGVSRGTGTLAGSRK